MQEYKQEKLDELSRDIESSKVCRSVLLNLSYLDNLNCVS